MSIAIKTNPTTERYLNLRYDLKFRYVVKKQESEVEGVEFHYLRRGNFYTSTVRWS